jgi:hypothetical protein
MNIIEVIKELAIQYARSKGFRPFDHTIELDMTFPWAIRDALHAAFLDQANVISSVAGDKVREMLADPQEPLRFKQLRLPENILINLFDGDDFIITLSKKPAFDPSQTVLQFPQEAGATVVQMYSDQAA